jgi:thiol-disulfide isomerase/thioredoxin
VNARRLLLVVVLISVAGAVVGETTTPPSLAGQKEEVAKALRELQSLPLKTKDSPQLWRTKVAPLLRTVLDARDATNEEKADALLAGADLCPNEEILAFTEQLERACAAFPQEPLRANVEMKRVLLLDRIDPDKASATLHALASDQNEKVASVAKGELRRRALSLEPLDLRFTALDGRDVDLRKWRGKVVLLDIWATWCVPCVKEMPQILALYRDYHSAGLEIVGISLDKERLVLERFVEKNAIPWPQYFQGNSPRNEFVDRFGITGIPQMWLVRRDGTVASFNTRDHLVEEVANELQRKE